MNHKRVNEPLKPWIHLKIVNTRYWFFEGRTRLMNTLKKLDDQVDFLVIMVHTLYQLSLSGYVISEY